MEGCKQKSFGKYKKNKSSELCWKQRTDDVLWDGSILCATAVPFRSRVDIFTFVSQLSCGAGISNNKYIPKDLFSYKDVYLNKQHTDNSFLLKLFSISSFLSLWPTLFLEQTKSPFLMSLCSTAHLGSNNTCLSNSRSTFILKNHYISL